MSKKITIIKSHSGFNFSISELWKFHELFVFFALRDIKLRYRHLPIAVFWTTAPPLVMSGVFNFTLGKVIKTPAHIPYIFFAFLGLIFWNYFSSVVFRSNGSLLSNQASITKIYFPRIILPLSSSAVSLVDFFISLLFFLLLALFFKIPINLFQLVVFIPSIVVTFLFASGLGMGFSALNIKYKDVRELLPLLTSLLFFLTPVIYPVKLVSDFYYPLLYLNPLMGVIDTIRNALFESANLNWGGFFVSFLSSTIIFCLGALYFKKIESEIADII